MAVENFLERMNALVEELKSHPKVTLINYFVPPPATEKDFTEVEAHIGMALPDDIKAFYRQCNGIQLRWVHKDNKNTDQKLWSGFIEGPFDYEEVVIEQGLEGIVNILGVKDVFFRNLPFDKTPLESYELPEPYVLKGTEMVYSDISKVIWSFDILNFEYDYALMLLPQEISSTKVVLLEMAHRIPAIDVPYFSLEQYLELIFLKKGVADARIFHVMSTDRDFNSQDLKPIESLEKIHDPRKYSLDYPYHR
jgi:hypothetical protein